MNQEPDLGQERYDEQTAAIEWYNRFRPPGHNHPCPVCDATDWTFGWVCKVPARIPFYFYEEGKAVQWNFHVMPVWCKTCSYTWFMNARVAGLIDESTPL